MRFLIPLALSLAACSPSVEAPTIATTVTTDIPLYTAEPDRRDLGRLSYLGGIEIDYADERFGGLSALHLNSDGSRMLAVSDSAYWVRAGLSWSDDGAPVALGGIDIAPILSRDGEALEGQAGDSEAIAALGGGLYAISFEREHRINVYELGSDWSQLDAVAQPLSAPDGAPQFENNGGMEGLTQLADGRLIAGVEAPSNGARQLWILDDGRWSRRELTAEPGYGLTALAAHGGHVYVLERFWTRETGNRIRILRFDAADLDDTARIEPDLLGTLTAGMIVDNFEGLAIIERNGQTVLLIVSDDNYSERQKTLLMAFAIEE